MGMSRTKRSFDREFKLGLMRALESGEKRPGQVCREHELSPTLLKRWREQYAEHGEAAWPAAPPPVDATPADRLKELEATVGRLYVENELLRSAVRRAEKGGFLPGRSGR